MSEINGKSNTQAETNWQRHQDEAARRIYVLPMPWPVKVEIWKEE